MRNCVWHYDESCNINDSMCGSNEMKKMCIVSKLMTTLAVITPHPDLSKSGYYNLQPVAQCYSLKVISIIILMKPVYWSCCLFCLIWPIQKAEICQCWWKLTLQYYNVYSGLRPGSLMTWPLWATEAVCEIQWPEANDSGKKVSWLSCSMKRREGSSTEQSSGHLVRRLCRG